MEKEIRAHCLAGPEVRPRDLQGQFRLTYSEACRALEELEALRLLGSRMAGGSRAWSASFPSDETRVLDLRRAMGWRSAA